MTDIPIDITRSDIPSQTISSHGTACFKMGGDDDIIAIGNSPDSGVDGSFIYVWTYMDTDPLDPVSRALASGRSFRLEPGTNSSGNRAVALVVMNTGAGALVAYQY